MPNEPEREIEKTLKAYARKRQADVGAPRGLHPATRRMLQAEAARVHARSGQGAGFWARWLGQSWPQLALGVGAVAVLAVTGVILYLNTNGPVQMASAPATLGATYNTRSIPAESPKVAPPSAAFKFDTSTGSGLKQKDEKKSTDRQPGIQSGKSQLAFDTPKYSPRNEPANEKSPAKLDAAGSIQNSVVTNSLLALDKEAPLATNSVTVTFAAASAPVASPPAPPVVAADTLTVARSESESAAKTRKPVPADFATRKFAQAKVGGASRLAKSRDNIAVLNSFQVETTGDQIRIVDSDGSVYAGHLESGPSEADTISGAMAAAPKSATKDLNGNRFDDGAKSALQPAAVPRSGGVPAVKLFFRVSGTNLSLKRLVVFSGNFVGTDAPITATTPSAPAAFGAIGGKAGEATKTPAATMPLGLPNIHIQGRAVIGTNELDILANPVDTH